jgi:hypothetical protein
VRKSRGWTLDRGCSRQHPCDIKKKRFKLDTAHLPDVTSPTLLGSQVHKQILVFAAGESVHPAIVLEMRGRLTRGVAFDPPLLDFGKIPAAKGSERLVRVTYDANIYVSGKTHLVASGEDGLQVLPFGVSSPSCRLPLTLMPQLKAVLSGIRL